MRINQAMPTFRGNYCMQTATIDEANSLKCGLEKACRGAGYNKEYDFEISSDKNKVYLITPEIQFSKNDKVLLQKGLKEAHNPTVEEYMQRTYSPLSDDTYKKLENGILTAFNNNAEKYGFIA